ncbi:MAG: methyltransferase domain-containing protein [Anaerolineae bacterium]|nr:methyltransferase domain-containing protein [Anaerolineae bacterium]
MATEMTLEEWEQQFSRQAGWTRATRQHLYRRANLLRAKRVLDVGSGTGVVTEEMAELTRGEVIGLDIDPAMVAFARRRGRHDRQSQAHAAQGGHAEYRLGDAHDLPFPDGWFDVTACHFVLLWCRDPGRAAKEMMRVTRPGGVVLVCAEPDYGGRIDYPDLPIGRWQAEALRGEGADPLLGRRLRALFPVGQADVGVIPSLWDLPTLRAEFDGEWSLWERSLNGVVSPEELARLRAADQAAVESGERLVFMPVFYALVRSP